MFDYVRNDKLWKFEKFVNFWLIERKLDYFSLFWSEEVFFNLVMFLLLVFDGNIFDNINVIEENFIFLWLIKNFWDKLYN